VSASSQSALVPCDGAVVGSQLAEPAAVKKVVAELWWWRGGLTLSRLSLPVR